MPRESRYMQLLRPFIAKHEGELSDFIEENSDIYPNATVETAFDNARLLSSFVRYQATQLKPNATDLVSKLRELTPLVFSTNKDYAAMIAILESVKPEVYSDDGTRPLIGQQFSNYNTEKQYLTTEVKNLLLSYGIVAVPKD